LATTSGSLYTGLALYLSCSFLKSSRIGSTPAGYYVSNNCIITVFFFALYLEAGLVADSFTGEFFLGVGKSIRSENESYSLPPGI
jgi:hypothetical protein